MKTLTQLHLTMVHPDSISPSGKGFKLCFPYPWKVPFCSLAPLLTEFHCEEQILPSLVIQTLILNGEG